MSISRREMIAASAAAGLTGWLGLAGKQSQARAAALAPTSKRLLRVAHITDTHIQPELAAAQGVAAALAHLQSQPDKPDLILHTGDVIMDGYGATRDRTKLQWSLWSDALKASTSIPIQYALGNHDIWGWNKPRAQATGTEPDYGKKWACDLLGLAKPYHSFDHAGWHFIALDSVRPYADRGYTAYLDEEQYDWLAGDLAAVGTQKPVLIMSHIPILSVTAYINTDTDPAATQPSAKRTGPYAPDRGDVVVSGTVQHGDFRRLKALFAKYPNVRLALSGHTHLVDRVDYNQVSYLCGGAVSAAWWKGLNDNECDFGYTLLDLHEDGSFNRTYTTYGWKAHD